MTEENFDCTAIELKVVARFPIGRAAFSFLQKVQRIIKMSLLKIRSGCSWVCTGGCKIESFTDREKQFEARADIAGKAE